MEFDANKHRENLASDQVFFPADRLGFFSSKPQTNREEFPPLEMLPPPSLSKGNNYLQEFNHLDQQFNSNIPTTNQMFGLQNSCFDHFDPSIGISECLPSNFDFYESKPFLSSTSSGGGGRFIMPSSMMENFQGGGGGGGCEILDQTHPIMNPSPMISMFGSFRNRGIVGGTVHDYGHVIDDQQPHKYRPPDEGSCTTADNIFRGMSSSSTKHLFARRGKTKKKKANVVKGQWTVEEDRLLVQLVERYGVRKWSQIAQMLSGRIGKQCRERWHNHLRPDIKKETWSEEEDRILIEAHAEIGNKWAEIAKRLPGRTENSIKNHWNATKRRQFSRRKCRSKYPRQSSLLQDYIKNLNLDIINAGCRKKSSVIAAAAAAAAAATNLKPGDRGPQTTHLQLQAAPADQITQAPASHNYNDDDGLEEDGLVPNYDDFGEVPDFNFDVNLFEESSIDSFLNEMDSTGGTHGGGGGGVHDVDRDHIFFDMNSPVMMSTADDEVVKKELDLVEMINQVNL